MNRLLLLSFATIVSCFAQADTPEALCVPADQKLLSRTHAVGDQIYTCKDADSQFVWTLKAPDARLLGTNGEVVGRHFAGPSWELKDGSSVTGKAAASVPSPDAQSIPWLLVNVVAHEGSGHLARASSIQRLHTVGGKAPAAGCDASHARTEARIAYEADYLFYGK